MAKQEWRMERVLVVACCFCIALLGAAAKSFAQEVAGEKGAGSALGVRQERVELMTSDLQKRFATLIQVLQKTDAAKAERLQATLEEAKKLQLTDRMKAIAGMLDDASLDKAGDGQKQLLEDIRALLVLLLDEKSDREKAREEYEKLEKWKAELENLIRSQEEQRRETEKLSDKEKALKELAERIAAVEKLIADQKGVMEKTEAARGEGRDAIANLSDAQRAVREDTEALAEKIGEVQKGSDKSEPKEGSAKPSENEGSPKESGKEGSQGKEGKEGEPKEASPMEGGGEESKGEEGKKGGAGSPPQPGEKGLQGAAKEQKQAEKNLEQGKAKNAADNEKAALAQLEAALSELKKEEQRIVSLPKEALKKQAAKQDELREKTAALEKQIREGSKSGGESKEGKESKKGTGEESLQEAQQAMEQASEELNEEDGSDAERKQRQAKKDLEKALQEIEERLKQLREETQIEKLAKLEARFREMLARQQKTTRDTAALEEKRKAGEKLLRTAHAPLVREERQLSESAQQAVDILVEDGTSVVFPDVVEQLRDDLLSTARLLEGKRTDDYTAGLQEEIEDQLEELIDALQKAQEQKESQAGGGGGGGGGEDPLLPNSAELKLLRLAQMRVNRRTTSLDAARGSDGSLDDTLAKEVLSIGERQAELMEMTLRIVLGSGK